MELELVIGTIRKGIKSTIKMHILIFDIGFQEKVKKLFPIFSDFWIISSRFTPKILNAPTTRVLTWLIL